MKIILTLLFVIAFLAITYFIGSKANPGSHPLDFEDRLGYVCIGTALLVAVAALGALAYILADIILK